MDKYMKVTTIIIVLAILFVVFGIARVIEFKGIEHEQYPKDKNVVSDVLSFCR
jgi:hypothetical protein